MIVIKTRGGIDRLACWSEVIERPLYRSKHNPNDASLRSIIGYYELKEEVFCGLSGCRTNHKKGYLIELSDGLEINIGNKCGRKAFDVEFETLTREFQTFREREDGKATVYEAKKRIKGWSTELNDLLNDKRGAIWANRNLKNILSKSVVGDRVARFLNEMIKRRSSLIEINHELTDKWEIDQQMAANPKMRYDEAKWIRKAIGSLDAFEALFPENDLQKLFIIQVQQEIKDLQECDPAKVSLSRLKYLTKAANDMPHRLELCRTTLRTARKFLSHSNLNQLLPAFEDHTQFKKEDKEKYLGFLEKSYNPKANKKQKKTITYSS